ncbi:MAG: hypothetical protein WCC64_03395 [Aliidongia sp.]
MKMKMSVHPKAGLIIEFFGEDSERYSMFLGDAISGDLTRTAWCDNVLERIEGFKDRHEVILLWEGNSFNIETDGKDVRIEFRVDLDTNSIFPLKDFQLALTAWRRFIDSTPGPGAEAHIVF